MEAKTLVDSVLLRPAIAKMDIPADDKRRLVQSVMNLAVGECTVRHDWEFAIGVTNHEGGTIADTATYRLIGASQDCRDIIDILYGDDALMLTEYRKADMDRLISQGVFTTDDDPTAWYREGFEDDFPVVRLIGTPGDDGDILRYRYRMKNVGVEKWPTDFGFVLESAIVKRIFPELTAQFEQDIRRMIDTFERPDLAYVPVPLDPNVALRNRERNKLHGY